MLLAAVCAIFQSTAESATPPPHSPWGSWVERDFPFFSSVVDLRREGSASNNLTPRGLVLNLGHDVWVCFDVDLLRVSAIWRGSGLTAKSMATISYHDPTRKSSGGKDGRPRPVGDIWLENGIYPGWQEGLQPSLLDPREPAPSPEELGRGALPENLGRFTAVRLVEGGAILEYIAQGAKIEEWTTLAGDPAAPVLERRIRVGPSGKSLLLVSGTPDPAVKVALTSPAGPAGAELFEANGLWSVRIPARRETIELTIAMGPGDVAGRAEVRPFPTQTPPLRWPQELATRTASSKSDLAYVVDHIGLPESNPWRRAVRLSDIQFLRDGKGVGVTLDGDVWLVRGLHHPSGAVTWKRFTSGLHEPLTIAIRDGEIFTFDRNGIWRLRDTNGDGEADRHELFSNAFAQTAGSREYASTLRLAPGGEFVIAKGGQQSDTLGKHNGSVLRISADGRRATVLGYGFRQPNIGVNLRTGLVTSSDQQGNYVPTTPLHVVRDGRFYGFLGGTIPREQYPGPIADPLTWVPHAVNASATSQVWLFDARLGPLNDGLVYMGFNKSELFRVLMHTRGSKPQAAVVSITRAFDFTPLHGSVHPIDGQLYLAGFQIFGFGSAVEQLAGLARVRYTGAPVTLPREVIAFDQGVLLRFEVALDPATAADPDRYALASWHYQRTYKYGSGHYKDDGTPGQNRLIASAAYLSTDRRGVFLAVPGMKPVMQLSVDWKLATSAGLTFDGKASLTPYELPGFDPRDEGFGSIEVDLKPRRALAETNVPASVEEGQRLANAFGCIACHAIDESGTARGGPSWKGLFGTQRRVAAGARTTISRTVDETYLQESILDPTANFAAGYEKSEFAMPSYSGILNDAQIDALILYIKSL